jgi:hypothetical protein
MAAETGEDVVYKYGQGIENGREEIYTAWVEMEAVGDASRARPRMVLVGTVSWLGTRHGRNHQAATTRPRKE